MKMSPSRGLLLGLLLAAGCDCETCDCPHEDDPQGVSDATETGLPPTEAPPAEDPPAPPVEPALPPEELPPPKEPVQATPYPWISGDALAIDKMGRIIVAGAIETLNGTTMAVQRFTPTGEYDLTFGNGTGYVIDGGHGNVSSIVNDVVIDSEGRIVVTGRVDYPAESETAPSTKAIKMAVWRLDGDGQSVEFSVHEGAVGFEDADNPWGAGEGLALHLDVGGRIYVTGVAGDMMTLWCIGPCVPIRRLETTGTRTGMESGTGKGLLHTDSGRLSARS